MIAATVLTMVASTFLKPLSRWIGSLVRALSSPIRITPWAAPK